MPIIPPENKLPPPGEMVTHAVDLPLDIALLEAFKHGYDGGWDGKWLLYYRDGMIWARRSWTGHLVFRFHVNEKDGRYSINRAEVSLDKENYGGATDLAEVEKYWWIFREIITNGKLLRKDLTFA